MNEFDRYWGWFDPDQKKPAAQKLAEACERHVEKFGVRPDRMLVGERFGGDRDFQAEAARQGVTLAVAPYVARWTIYVGIGRMEPEQAPATVGQLTLAGLVGGA